MYKIKELTPAEVQAIAAEFPFANPKPYLVLEDDRRLDYWDTREAAEKSIAAWEARDELSGEISDFTREMLASFEGRLPEDEIRGMIKAQ